MPTYSIWLEPPANVAAKAQRFIRDIASRVPVAPMFTAHVTLIGGFAYPCDDDARAAFARVLESATALRCATTSIACGMTRHQCVYAKLEKTPALVAAFEAANAVIQLPGASSDGFTPHMSLAYGIEDGETREAVRAEAESTLLGSDSCALDFDVASYSLWLTDVADDSCESWVRLSERNVGCGDAR